MLHFGEPVRTEDADALMFRPGLGWGGAVLLEAGDPASCADVMPLAWSGAGRGDYRESPLELGGVSTDFRYVDYEITNSAAPMKSGLPQARGECETLRVTMAQEGLELSLYFSVFGGVMTRRTVLKNIGGAPVTLTKIMSSMMDIYGEYNMTTF